MMNNEFYLTLASNSSMSSHRDNKTSKFITLLPKIISLDGHWEVALAEIHFPMTLCNIHGKQGEYIVLDSSRTKVFQRKLPARHYENIDDLLYHLNGDISKIPIPEKISLSLNAYDRVMVTTKGDPSIRSPSILTSEIMALQLGFEPGRDIVGQGKARRPPDLSVGYPAQMYVYCDLVEPQIIGDTIAPLLRIVSTKAEKTKYGLDISHVFTRPFYLPVLKREFETVEIDLRSHTGHPIPFLYGTSVVVLHFRRRRDHGKNK